jgi:small-conductance mechanosensitive channel
LTWKELIFVSAFLAPALSALQTAAPEPPTTPAPLALTQIAVRDEELRTALREISRQLPPPSELADFSQQLAEREEAVGASLEESAELLAGNATIMETREQTREWRAYGSPEARQRRILAEWGTACEQSIAALNKHQAVWRATLASTQSIAELESVRLLVRQSLSEIDAVKASAEERLRTIVELQGRVSKQASAIADTIDKLGEATLSFQKRLFRADAPPIWKQWSAQANHESLGAIFRRALGRSYSTSTGFVQTRQRLVLQTALWLVFAFLAVWRFGATLRKTNSSDPRLLQASRILRRPVSLSVLLAAPLVLASLPLTRVAVVLLILEIFLLPVVRLLPLISGCNERVARFLAAFYGLHGLVWLFDAEPSAGRVLSALLFAITLPVLAWWGRPVAMRRTAGTWAPQPGMVPLLRALFGALALILVANVFGFLMLSNLLRVVLVLCAYVGLVIYMLARVLSILIAAAFASPPLRSLAIIKLREAAVMRWTVRSLNIVASACWIYLVLDLLTLKSDVSKGIDAFLSLRLGIRGFGLSLGNMLGCVCVLVGGYLIARAVRFVLREEILSRLRLSRGVPETISTSSYYVLLLLVFLMSLAAAGVQLDKLTVLTGAFGVGVGFGLQSLVNNFVSGLVLQFERPIHLGDVLEVGNLTGEVRRIGIRSSVVRTFQGAEVIVPNSALVSNQVVNWTLSEPVRRVELQVPVAYGTSPECVIELLTGVALEHPEVLREPGPAAFFQAFGASSLDFLLMFWAEQQTHFRLRSEIAVAVNAALKQAGIQIPFPQQEIRVLSIDGPALSQVAGSGNT